ncbi:hypothetical protein M427DRAFT_94201, partial [Gonapodya prolifera JEL478]
IVGGNLHNNVVVALAERLNSLGFACLRFNFRGIGRSTGWPTFRGTGETQDMLSVCRYLLWGTSSPPVSEDEPGPANPPPIELGPSRDPVPRPDRLIIVGYSYGSLQTFSAVSISPSIRARTRGIVAVAYPYGVLWALTLFDGSSYSSACAEGCADVPKLFVMGDADNFTSADALREFVEDEVDGRKMCVILAGKDHFFGGEEDDVCDIVEEWVTGLEQSG